MRFNTNDLTSEGVAYGVPADQAVFNTPPAWRQIGGEHLHRRFKNNAIRMFTQIADTGFGDAIA